jgi:hypothetical protein
LESYTLRWRWRGMKELRNEGIKKLRNERMEE